MPVTLTESWVHEGLSPYRLFQIRNRLEYQQAKGEHLGMHEFKVLELRERDDRFRCVTRMKLDIDIPMWLRRLIQPRMQIVQQELWHPPEPDGTRRMDIIGEVVGAPLAIQGQGVLRSLEWVGSHYTLTMTITSYRKIIGPRIEKVAAEQARNRIIKERDFALEWITAFTASRWS